MIITTADELVRAVRDGDRTVTVGGRITGVPALRLEPGVELAGAGPDAAIEFDAEGLILTRDNTVRSLRLVTAPERAAVGNDTGTDGLGTLRLTGLATVGGVLILARDRVRSGHVVVDGLDIEAADARDRLPRPRGYNVEVLQGAFTLYNQQTDPTSLLTADLVGIGAGRAGAPARGSGVFVSGTDGGGRVEATRLHTGAVHSDGGIPKGTPGQITGGVFVGYASVEEVHNQGTVTTYGVNDMVLNVWGAVADWTASAPVTSHGPSGIGFVSFGTVGRLTVTAPIETFGAGAHGFNIYDGTVGAAEFDRIVTHADAAVGIQISRSFGTLAVHRGIETHGGVGDSRVKGAITTLAATGLSLRPGASARAVRVDGGITVHGAAVPAVELLGSVGELALNGPITAAPAG